MAKIIERADGQCWTGSEWADVGQAATYEVYTLPQSVDGAELLLSECGWCYVTYPEEPEADAAIVAEVKEIKV